MWKLAIALGVLGVVGCNRAPEHAGGNAGEGDEKKYQDVACGQNTCTGGQICCNPSCGICAPPDGMCTQQFCDTPVNTDGGVEELPTAPVTCEHVRCASGTHCEMVEVQCIKAPCPPVPECRPDQEEKK